MEFDRFSRFEELSIHAARLAAPFWNIVKYTSLIKEISLIWKGKLFGKKSKKYIHCGFQSWVLLNLPSIFKDGKSFDFTAVESPHSTPLRMCWMNIYASAYVCEFFASNFVLVFVFVFVLVLVLVLLFIHQLIFVECKFELCQRVCPTIWNGWGESRCTEMT